MVSSPPGVAFTVAVRAEAEDEAVAVLWELGTSGVHVQPGEGSGVVLLAYFPAGRTGESLRAALASLGAEVQPAAVPEVDWVARFRENFRAFEAAGFHVVPAWDPAARQATERQQHVLVVDPGRAFGTGTHETTRLCLGAIAHVAASRPLGRVLDLGCGTGILGVAALRCGATRVVAADNDPEALDSVRLHAQLNGVELLPVLCDGGRGIAAGAFDLVLANISAPLLRERAAEILRVARRPGSLVLSGFLADDVDDLQHLYRGLVPDARCTLDGVAEWRSLRLELS